LEADTKTLSSQIIIQLINKDPVKRKTAGTYEDILTKKLKGKPMMIPLERDFILHNFDRAMTLEDRMTQSKIFADTLFQTYQVDNALN
jgi:hypothetical protein